MCIQAPLNTIILMATLHTSSFQGRRILFFLAFFVSPLQGDFMDEIPFPGVTPFGLTPGCNISPLQGDYNAIIPFPALILNVNYF